MVGVDGEGAEEDDEAEMGESDEEAGAAVGDLEAVDEDVVNVVSIGVKWTLFMHDAKDEDAGGVEKGNDEDGKNDDGEVFYVDGK